MPLSPNKRTRSKAIVAEVVRRFGGDVSWYADGGLTGFSYTPASYTSVSSLVSEAQDKKGNFSLSLFEKKLKSSARTMSRWRRDLATVASRAGTDVARALEEMGEDGVSLTRKMATGSSKYVRQMSRELRALADASRASLTHYTGQLKAAVKDQAAFERDLAKLAAAGYGDLASRLAAQGGSGRGRPCGAGGAGQPEGAGCEQRREGRRRDAHGRAACRPREDHLCDEVEQHRHSRGRGRYRSGRGRHHHRRQQGAHADLEGARVAGEPSAVGSGEGDEGSGVRGRRDLGAGHLLVSPRADQVRGTGHARRVLHSARGVQAGPCHVRCSPRPRTGSGTP